MTEAVRISDHAPMLEALSRTGWKFGVDRSFTYNDYPGLIIWHSSELSGDEDMWFCAVDDMIIDLWDARCGPEWPNAEEAITHAVDWWKREQEFNERVKP